MPDQEFLRADALGDAKRAYETMTTRGGQVIDALETAAQVAPDVLALAGLNPAYVSPTLNVLPPAPTQAVLSALPPGRSLLGGYPVPLGFQRLVWAGSAASGTWQPSGQPLANAAQVAEIGETAGEARDLAGTAAEAATGVAAAVSYDTVADLVADTTRPAGVAAFAGGDRWVPDPAAGPPRAGAVVDTPRGKLRRDYDGPVRLQWQKRTGDITAELQDTLAFAAERGDAPFAGTVIIDVPDYGSYDVTDTLILRHGGNYEGLRVLVRPSNLEVGEGALFNFKPQSSGLAFLRLDPAERAGSGGYRDGVRLRGFSARVHQDFRESQALYADLHLASDADLGVAYVDGFHTVLRGGQLMNVSIHDMVCRAFQRGVHLLAGDAVYDKPAGDPTRKRIGRQFQSTTVREQRVYWKGLGISDLVYLFEAGAVHSYHVTTPIYESVRRIGDIQKNSNITVQVGYSENIGYNPAEGLPAWQVGMNGDPALDDASSRAVNLATLTLTGGGTWEGINGTVHSDSLFVQADEATVSLGDMTLKRFGSDYEWTDKTRVFSVAGSTKYVQMGSAAQPNFRRRRGPAYRMVGGTGTNLAAPFDTPSTQAPALNVRGYGETLTLRHAFQVSANDVQIGVLEEDAGKNITGFTEQVFLDGRANNWNFRQPPSIPTLARNLLPAAFQAGMTAYVSNPEAGRLPLVRVVDRGEGADPRNQWQYLDGTPVTLS